MISALITVGLLIVAGLPAAFCFRQLRSVSLRVSLAFLLGCGVVVTALFFLSALSLAWTTATVLTAILSLWAISVLVAIRGFREAQPTLAAPSSRLSFLLDALTVITIIAHLRFATWTRLREWDYLANWGLKARVFYEHRGIDWFFLRFPSYNFTMPDYPPMVPLLMSFFALVRGQWEDRWLGILFTAFGVATILIIRGLAMHETASQTEAAIAGLAVASPALPLFVGLGDGAVAAFGTAAILLIRSGNILGGATILGLAMLSKNEGTALLIATAASLALVSGAQRWRKVLQLWPALVMFLPWLIVRRWLDLSPAFMQGNPATRLVRHLRRTPQIIEAFFEYPPDQLLMWISLLIIVIWRSRWIWQKERFLAGVLFIQFSALVAQNFLTSFHVEAHIEHSWHRLCFQLAPLLIVLALLSVRGVLVAGPESPVTSLSRVAGHESEPGKSI